MTSEPPSFLAEAVLEELSEACSNFKPIPVPPLQAVQIEFLKHRVVKLSAQSIDSPKLSCESLNRLLETIMELEPTGENRVCLGCCILAIITQLELSAHLAMKFDQFEAKYVSLLTEPLSVELLWLCNVTRIACHYFVVKNNKGYIREIVGRFCNVSFSVGTKRKGDGTLKVFPLRLFVEVEGMCPKTPRPLRSGECKIEGIPASSGAKGPATYSGNTVTKATTPIAEATEATEDADSQDSDTSAEDQEMVTLLQDVTCDDANSSGKTIVEANAPLLVPPIAPHAMGVPAPLVVAGTVHQQLPLTADGVAAPATDEPMEPAERAATPSFIIRDGPQMYTLLSSVGGKRTYMSIYEEYDP